MNRSKNVLSHFVWIMSEQQFWQIEFNKINNRSTVDQFHIAIHGNPKPYCQFKRNLNETLKKEYSAEWVNYIQIFRREKNKIFCQWNS